MPYKTGQNSITLFHASSNASEVLSITLYLVVVVVESNLLFIQEPLIN